MTNSFEAKNGTFAKKKFEKSVQIGTAGKKTVQKIGTENNGKTRVFTDCLCIFIVYILFLFHDVVDHFANTIFMSYIFE